ncbi:MAG: leucine-rich repeat protein [Floccifex sp.]
MKKKILTTLFVAGMSIAQTFPASAQEPGQQIEESSEIEQQLEESSEVEQDESQQSEDYGISLLSEEDIVYPTTIILNQTKLQNLVQGKTLQLKVNGYAPSEAKDHLDVTWTSSDSTIASVDANGLVTGLKGGLVTITATCNGKNADMDKPASASVQVNVKGIEGNYQYVINNGTITIDKYLGDETNITIPSTIDGMPVTNIGTYSFYFATNAQSIVSVKIPSGVTTIGDYAFNACANLSSVSIPSSVTTIGQRAFWKTALPSIVIPEGVTTIGKEAFAKCANLTSISLPQSLSTINANAFSDTGLSSITLPDNISSIGTSALSGIETIYANPNTTTYQTLLELGIQPTVVYPTSIGITTDSKNVVGKSHEIVQGNTAQFYVNSYSSGSTNHDVTWSVSDENIASIDENGNVTILKEGTVDVIATCIGQNEDMESPAQARFALTCIGIDGNFQYKTKEDGTILIDEYIGNEEEVIIPSTIDGKPVTEIYNAFFAKKGIKRVVIPQGVITLDKEAFASCSDLESVSLPSSLKTIGERAFAYTNLKEVIIPEGVTSIGRNAFNNCKQLEKVTLPSTLKYINPLAFTSTGLKSIVLPDNITYIGTNALKGIETIIVNPGTTTEQTLKEAGISYSYPLFELNQIPVIECEDITISLNASFDPYKDVKAMDAEDGDLTKDIVILDNNVDVSKEGEYTIVYEVKDSQGASCQKIRKVKVIKETITKEETKTKDKTIKKSNVSTGAFSSLALNISLLLSSLGSLILFKRRK